MPHLLDKLKSVRYKWLIPQLLLLLAIYLVFHRIAENVQANMQSRGVALGFDFLSDRAGFGIIFHLIEYSSASHYWQVFWVGVTNTLFVAVIGIFFASILGFWVGVSSISKSKPIALLAKSFVEIIRNIPLLLQLFFWYFVVLRAAPYPQDSIHIADSVFITNRGIYFPKPIGSLYTTICLAFVFIMLGLSALCAHLKKSWRHPIVILFVTLTICLFIIFLSQLTWERPLLGKFNFEGGYNLIPEFLALVFALSTYTAAYIAEIVRMGLQSVPKGQYEAARSLGLTRYQSLRLIIFPQALRVIIPPLTNQYLNLTKNSSLATAIAYPDLVSVFAGTVLNQTGHAIEIILMTMGVYLFISLCLSLLMMAYERRVTWV
ncbi:MAG: amino acid ABC transporter permease [Candidatus Berkiella sp.]